MEKRQVFIEAAPTSAAADFRGTGGVIPAGQAAVSHDAAARGFAGSAPAAESGQPGPRDATARDPAEHRAHPRDSMLLKANLHVDGAIAPVAFRVRNLSASGLMGEAPITIAPGAQVLVELRSIGTIGATVAWAVGNRFGLAFYEMIDPRRVRQEFVGVVQPEVTSVETADLVVRRPLVLGKERPRDPYERRFV